MLGHVATYNMGVEAFGPNYSVLRRAANFALSWIKAPSPHPHRLPPVSQVFNYSEVAILQGSCTYIVSCNLQHKLRN